MLNPYADRARWLDKRLEKSIWNSAKHYMRADGGTGRIFVSAN